MEVVDVKHTFIEMRAKGYSYDKIAKELGKAKQTLIDWGKELQDEIANSRAMELEALYESYYLTKENRLQTLGAMVAKIKEEVLSRPLSDVPTDKLLELLLKYNNQVGEEVVEPSYKTSMEIEEERLDREILEQLTDMRPPMKKLKVG